MKNGLLIVYSGPSGVGKNTVRGYFENDKSLNLAFSVSMTTRPKRNGEIEGVHYFFVTKERFKEAIENDELLEHAEFVGNWYGTPRHFVDKLRKQGKNVLLEIEVQGALQVMEKIKDCVTIFLVPPSMEELEKRLRSRGTEDEVKILNRLKKAKKELSLKEKYKYVIVNDDPKIAGKEITELLRKEIEK